MPDYNVNILFDMVDKTVKLPTMGDFSLTPKDMLVALSLFRVHQPSRVLEFGVCQGHTAAFLLRHCPFISEYVGVDLEPELFPARGIVPRVAGALAIDDPRYSSVLTDETVDDFRLAIQTSKPGLFDCVIMDANHEDWATKRDTEACLPLLTTGGLILWHDYNVESRQHSNGLPFSLKGYLDELAKDRCIHMPADVNRDPWTCCSLAWSVK
ncbi:MAG: class I SAM-dependent methyltransferase [bacterium]